MKTTITLAVFTILFSAAFALSDARATQLYGIGTLDFNNPEPPSNLYTIDPSTGNATLVGPVGFPLCTALEFNLATEVLYAVCLVENDPNLIIIDVLTGAGTLVGSLGLTGENPRVADMSFRSDGTLFAFVYDDDDNSRIGTIDLNTGIFTSTGDAGSVINQPTIFVGLGFTADDTLLMAGLEDSFDQPYRLWSVNQVNSNEVSFITTLDIPVEMFTVGLITSLDTNPEDGQLYSQYAVLEGGFELDETVLSTLNPTSGLVTRIGGNGEPAILAIAFPNPPDVVRNVPTLSEWGLIAMAGILGLVGFIVIRRRNAAA